MRLKTPGFWYRRRSAPAPVQEILLSPLSWFYAAGYAVNQNFYDPAHADMPVICVGNLVAGGSGKTPAAIALMQLLHQKKISLAPHFLTRGYGGAETGPMMVDYFKHGCDEVGDESLLLAKSAYTILSADRVAGARFAAQRKADLILMDDGFQNGSLHKDISFIVVDGHVGFGNGKMLPAGPLREPLFKGIERADAVILIGKDKAGINEILPDEKPVFTAHVEIPEGQKPDPSLNYVAFSGLGRPEKFYHQLQQLGLKIAGWHPYPDHYAYQKKDMDMLVREAKSKNAILITTEKDHKRLPEVPTDVKIVYLPIELIWDQPDDLAAFLQQKLAARSS